MAAIVNKYKFFLDTIRTSLTIDTTLAVRPMWQSEESIPATKTLVYANIIQDQAVDERLENSRSTYTRVCTVGIIARFTIPTSKTGNADKYYGDVIERINARLDALDTTLMSDPILGTSPRYNITLYAIQRAASSGYIDDGGTDGVIQQELQLHYSEMLI